MNQKPNLEALLAFLEYLAEKGLMKRQTVAARKAVANKVFSALDASDREDVLSVNIDEIIDRFVNLEGNKYTPESLQTYKSRLKSTVEDFASYRKDPMSFKPSVQQRAARRPKTRSDANADFDENVTFSPESKIEPAETRSIDQPASIIPIPLRADLTIKIQGLPFDLTVAEANKLAAVIKAYAVSE